MSCGLTHRGRARLEQQLGLSLPFLHGVEVHHLCVCLWSCRCGLVQDAVIEHVPVFRPVSPRRFAGPIEGMKSGLGVWETVDHAFPLVREAHEVTAVVRAVNSASRDSLLHSTTCSSLASRERPHLSSPKVLLATIIQEIYIASL